MDLKRTIGNAKTLQSTLFSILLSNVTIFRHSKSTLICVSRRFMYTQQDVVAGCGEGGV